MPGDTSSVLTALFNGIFTQKQLTSLRVQTKIKKKRGSSRRCMGSDWKGRGLETEGEREAKRERKREEEREARRML